MKPLVFEGSCRDELSDFPDDARTTAGFELYAVQIGQEPSHWKPIPNWGSGVIELKIVADDGQYRVVYVAKFAEAVYVLHAFQKKTQKTGQRDVDLVMSRYRALIERRRR